LTPYMKSYMGFSNNPLLENPRGRKSAAIFKIDMTSFLCRKRSNLDKISQAGAEWFNEMSTEVVWSKSKPDVEFQYGGRLGKFNGMSSQSYVPHCRVLPLGEFNVMIPDHMPHCGVLSPSEFNVMSFQSQVSHCRVLPPGEFNVMIPEPRATLYGAATWRIQWHVIPSHVPHCRVLPLGEFNVMIPEPHATFQGAVT